jgi:hypothetical protein
VTNCNWMYTNLRAGHENRKIRASYTRHNRYSCNPDTRHNRYSCNPDTRHNRYSCNPDTRHNSANTKVTETVTTGRMIS